MNSDNAWAPFIAAQTEEAPTSIEVQAPRDCLVRRGGGSVDVCVRVKLPDRKQGAFGRLLQAAQGLAGSKPGANRGEITVLELWTWEDLPRPTGIFARLTNSAMTTIDGLARSLHHRPRHVAAGMATPAVLDDLVVLADGLPVPSRWSSASGDGRYCEAGSTRILADDPGPSYEIRFSAKNLISPARRQWPFPQVRLRLGLCVPQCRKLPTVVRWIYPAELQVHSRQDNSAFVSEELGNRSQMRERISLFKRSTIRMEWTWGTSNIAERLAPAYQLMRTGAALVMVAAGLVLHSSGYDGLAGVVFAISLAPVLIRLVQASEGAGRTFTDLVWGLSFLPYVILGLGSAVAVVWPSWLMQRVGWPTEAAMASRLEMWDLDIGGILVVLAFAIGIAAMTDRLSRNSCDWWRCNRWLLFPSRGTMDRESGRRLCPRHRVHAAETLEKIRKLSHTADQKAIQVNGVP